MPSAAFRSVVDSHESLIKVWPSAFGLARNVSPKTQTEFPANKPLYPPSRPRISGLLPITPRSVACTTDKLAGGPGEPQPNVSRTARNPQTARARPNARTTPPETQRHNKSAAFVEYDSSAARIGFLEAVQKL